MNKVVIIDTSILCCWLKVLGKDTCGSDNNRWDHVRAKVTIEEEIDSGAILVLPLAVIIETGNHISQAPDNRYECAQELIEMINKASDFKTPWAAFSDQTGLWETERLKELAREWGEEQVSSQISIGDSTIIKVAEYYYNTNVEVKILTGDKGLKAFEPGRPTRPERRVPRRRGRR